MSDDKRTFEVNAHLLQNPRLHVRPAKGKAAHQEPVLGIETEEPLDRNPLPVTQDMILRLIKVLKGS
jgi:hypothetical protein